MRRRARDTQKGEIRSYSGAVCTNVIYGGGGVGMVPEVSAEVRSRIHNQS